MSALVNVLAARVNSGDPSEIIILLLAVLGLVGVGVGVWLLSRAQWIGGVVAVIVGLVVIVVALG